MKLRRLLSFVTVAAALTAAGTHEARVRSDSRADLARVQRAAETLRLQLIAARAEHVRLNRLARDATSGAAASADQADPFVPTGDATFDADGRELLRRVYALRKWIDRNPSEWIPEIRHARDGDWFETVAERSAENDTLLATTAAHLRHQAKFAFLASVQRAFDRYVEENNGARPTDVRQLSAYLAAPSDEAALARYQIVGTGPLRTLPENQPVLEERMSPEEREDADVISVNGLQVRVKVPVPSQGSAESKAWERRSREIFRAIEAYRKSHEGEQPTDIRQLAPLVRDPAMLKGVEIEVDGFSYREELPREEKR